MAREPKPKAKVVYKFESDNEFLFVFPNIQFKNGKYETDNEEVANILRQFSMIREV